MNYNDPDRHKLGHSGYFNRKIIYACKFKYNAGAGGFFLTYGYGYNEDVVESLTRSCISFLTKPPSGQACWRAGYGGYIHVSMDLKSVKNEMKKYCCL